MSKQNIQINRDRQTLPICGRCEKNIDTVSYRELHGGFWGRTYIYFCPGCKSTLGVSQRKGFFMG